MPRKEKTYKIRLEDDEKETFQIAADLSGIKLAAWMRERLRRVAMIELQEAGEEVPFRKKK